MTRCWQQTFVSHSSMGWEVRDLHASMARFWRGLHTLPSHYILAGGEQGEEKSSCVFSYKNTNLIRGYHSHDLITLQRPYLPIQSHWGLVSTYEFWGDINMQSIIYDLLGIPAIFFFFHVLKSIKGNSLGLKLSPACIQILHLLFTSFITHKIRSFIPTFFGFLWGLEHIFVFDKWKQLWPSLTFKVKLSALFKVSVLFYLQNFQTLIWFQTRWYTPWRL